MVVPENSLVLYKSRPARVISVLAPKKEAVNAVGAASGGDKIELQLPDGAGRKVRLKDILLLHPGPLRGLGELNVDLADGAAVNVEPDAETARAILAPSNEPTTLKELAELIYGQFTPTSAWATWQLVSDGLLFRGSPDRINARSAEEVEHEHQLRSHKLAEKRAWDAFIERLRTGSTIPEDEVFLAHVEKQALGQQTKTRVLRLLGRSESPENAHALLLETGYWNHADVPYPARLRLPLGPAPDDLFRPQNLPESAAEHSRLDLTHLPAFAIDDAGNRDPDDALSLAGDRLWVHVADVASIVTAGSAMDIEARGRGSSLYLPERLVPMLPLSVTHRLGLGLSEISTAMSFGLDIGPDGEVVNLEIVPTLVRVSRLTYEEAEQRLDSEPLVSIYRITEAAQTRRWTNGAVFIDWPEIRVRVSDDGIQFLKTPELRSREMVSEAMLMAGESIARFSIARGIPIPYSTQESPEEAEVPDGLAGMLARRRALGRSRVRATCAPHHGLGLDNYTQATSPLRRYLDLVVHQQLRSHLMGHNLLNEQELSERVAVADAVTGAVRQTERLCSRHWALVYLLQQPDWVGRGIVVDITPKHGGRSRNRGIVFIPELGLEVSMHLPGDPPLNAELRLSLGSVDLPRLEAHFHIVDD